MHKSRGNIVLGFSLPIILVLLVATVKKLFFFKYIHTRTNRRSVPDEKLYKRFRYLSSPAATWSSRAHVNFGRADPATLRAPAGHPARPRSSRRAAPLSRRPPRRCRHAKESAADITPRCPRVRYGAVEKSALLLRQSSAVIVRLSPLSSVS